MRGRRLAVAGAIATLLAACGATGGDPSRSPYSTPGEREGNTQRAASLTRQASALVETAPAQAEQLLCEALAEDIFYGPAHNNLGVVHLGNGRLYEAATEFEWARKLMNGHPDPRVNLAIVLERAGRTDAAAEAFLAALEDQKDYLPAVQGLALLTVSHGRSDERLRDWLEQVALQSDEASWRHWALTELEKEIASEGRGP